MKTVILLKAFNINVLVDVILLRPSGTSSILEEELYTSDLWLLENSVADFAEAYFGFPDVVFLDESEFLLNG